MSRKRGLDDVDAVSSDSDGAVDSFDENLMRDAADEQALFSLPEVEREEIIAQRYEARREKEEARKVRRQLRRQRRLTAEKAKPKAAKPKPKAKAAAKKPASRGSTEYALSDGDDFESLGEDDDDEDEDFGEKPSKRARTSKKGAARTQALEDYGRRRRQKGLKTSGRYSSEDSGPESSIESDLSDFGEDEEFEDDFRRDRGGPRLSGRQAREEARRQKERMVEITTAQAPPSNGLVPQREPANGWKHIREVTLTRSWIEDHINEPWFERMVPGFFVRLSLGNGVYRLARLEGVVDRSDREYALTIPKGGAKTIPSTTKWLNLRIGSGVRLWEIRSVSNGIQEITLDEFNFTREEALKELDSDDGWHNPVEYAYENQRKRLDGSLPDIIRGGTAVAILEGKPWLTVGDIEDLKKRKRDAESYAWQETDIQANIQLRKKAVRGKDAGLSRHITSLRNAVECATDPEKLAALQKELAEAEAQQARKAQGRGGRADDEAVSNATSAARVKEINQRNLLEEEKRRERVAREQAAEAARLAGEQKGPMQLDPFARRKTQPRSIFAAMKKKNPESEEPLPESQPDTQPGLGESNASITTDGGDAEMAEVPSSLSSLGSAGLDIDAAQVEKLKQERQARGTGTMVMQKVDLDIDIDLDLDMTSPQPTVTPVARPAPAPTQGNGVKKMSLSDYMKNRGQA